MALVLNCWESAHSNGAAVDSLTVNKPTSASANGDSPKNAAVGDLLIILVGNDCNTDTAQWDNALLKPTGFTLINVAGGAASDCWCAAFYKVVDGTEGASFDIPQEANEEEWAACILISGGGNPYVHQTGADCSDETPAPLAITGVTNTAEGCINFYVAALDGGDAGGFAVAGAGWAEREEIYAGTASGDACGCWGTRHVAGTGASGTASVTPTTADGMYGFQFSVAEDTIPIVAETATNNHGATNVATLSLLAAACITWASVQVPISYIHRVYDRSCIYSPSIVFGESGPGTHNIVVDNSTNSLSSYLPIIAQSHFINSNDSTNITEALEPLIDEVGLVDLEVQDSINDWESEDPIITEFGTIEIVVDNSINSHNTSSPLLSSVGGTTFYGHPGILTPISKMRPGIRSFYYGYSITGVTQNVSNDGSSHGHSGTSPPLEQIHAIAPILSTIALSSSEVTLTETATSAIAADDCTHALSSTESSLGQALSLSPATSTIEVFSSSPQLTQAHEIAPILSTITQTAENTLLLEFGTITISSDDCTHSHSSSNVTLTGVQSLSPARSFIFQHINEHITNPNMEFDSDWADYGNPSLNERNGEAYRDGQYSRHVKDDTPTDKAGIYQVAPKTAGHHYGFSFDYYLYDTVYVDTLHVTVANGAGSAYLHDETYTETNVWRSVQVADLLETNTGSAEVVFANNSDAVDIEFIIDKVSLWKHVDIQETFKITTIDTGTITLSSTNSELAEFAGPTSISVQDTEHDLSSTEPYLSVSHGLSPNVSTISLSSSEPSVNSNVTISVADATHLTSATEPTLTHVYLVTPETSEISLSSTLPEIDQLHALSPDLSTIALSSSDSDISGNIPIVSSWTNHDISSTEPTLYQYGGLTSSDCTVAHAASSPGVVQNHLISLDLSTITQTVSSPSVDSSGYTTLVNATATHETSATNVTLFQWGTLSVSDCTHTLSSTGSSASKTDSVVAQGAEHATSSTEPVVSTFNTVVSANTTHDLSSDSPALAQVHSISPANCTHITAAEEIFYSGNLVCATCTHDQTTAESTVFDYIRPIWVFATKDFAYEWFARDIDFCFITPNGVTYDFWTRPKRYATSLPLHAGASDVITSNVFPYDGTHVITSGNIDFVNFATESNDIALHNLGTTKSTLTNYQILDVQNSAHDWSSTDTGTVLNNTLTLQSASHDQSVDNSTVAANYTISGDTSTHSLDSTISTLDEYGADIANAQNCEHDTASSNVEMTIWDIAVTSAKCRHYTYATSPTITQIHAFTVAWATHTIASDEPSVVEVTTTTMANADIAHSTTSPTLEQIHAVDSDACEHDQTVELNSFEQWPTLLDVQTATTTNAIYTTDSSVTYLGLSFGFMRSIFRPFTEMTPYFMPIPLASQGVAPSYSIPLANGTISHSVSECILNSSLPIAVETSTHDLSSTEVTLTEVVYTNLDVDDASHDHSGVGVYFEAPITAGFVDILRPFTKGGARFIRAPRGKGTEYARSVDAAHSLSSTSPVISVSSIDIDIMETLDDGVTESDTFTGDGAYYWGFVVEGSRFTNSHRIARVTYSLTKAAGDISAQSYTCKIWTMSGNNLGTQVGAASGAVTGSNSWSSSDVTFVFSMPIPIQSGTRYAFTIDHGAVDNANRISIGMSDLVGDAELASGLWAADETVVTYSAGNEPYFRLYCSEYDHLQTATSPSVEQIYIARAADCTHVFTDSSVIYEFMIPQLRKLKTVSKKKVII